MRFLCFHGGGTNNRIFELQMAAIRYELGSGHSFEFVEGSVPHAKGPGIDSLVSPGDTFFIYHDASAQSVSKAVNDVQEYIESAGPFDAILAFSMGCRLAATWCFRCHSQNVPIKAVILFSGEPAFSQTALSRNSAEDLDPLLEGKACIPSLHIWGSKDSINPERNRLLYEQWDDAHRVLVTHDGGHELPGPGMERPVTEIVNQIRRICR